MAHSAQTLSRIEEIALQIFAGKKRKDLSNYAGLWGVSQKTLDRIIGWAQQRAKEMRQEVDQAVSKEIAQNATEQVKKGLKSVEDVDMRLQKVIFGKPKIIKSGKGTEAVVLKVENTVSDIVRAIDVYYKRHNYYDKEVIDKSITIIVNGKKIGTVDGSR